MVYFRYIDGRPKIERELSKHCVQGIGIAGKCFVSSSYFKYSTVFCVAVCIQLLALRVNMQNGLIALFSVYAPTCQARDGDKNDF